MATLAGSPHHAIHGNSHFPDPSRKPILDRIAPAADGTCSISIVQSTCPTMKSEVAQKTSTIRSPRFGVWPRTCVRLVLALAWAASVQLAVGAAEPPGRMRLQLPPSSAIESRLNAAQRQIDNQRWDVALPLLHEIIQQEGETLVWTGDAYEPPALVARRKLAALPPGGRRAYVLLYEPEAGRLLAKGIRRRSEPLLAQVAREYGNTPSGARAAGALADLLMDEGRFHDALHALSSARADVPSGEGDRLLLARKIACLAHLGNAAGVRRAVQAARERDITEVAPAGEPMSIEKFAERCLRRHAPAQPRGSAGPALEPNLSYSVSFDIGTAGGSPVGLSSIEDTLFVGGEDGVTALDVQRLRVRRLASPAQLLRRTAAMLKAPGPEDDVPLWLPVGDLDFWRRTVNQGTHTVAATGDRVLTVHVDFGALQLPEEPWNARPGNVLLPNTLRCVDARDGRLFWRAGGREGRPLAGFWFPTAPAIERNRCYVLGVRTGVLWAICLDLADGKEVWRSRVGAIASRNETQRYIMEFYLADASPPVVTRGLAVFPTGQGAVAAFTARDGRPRWLTPYPRSDRDIPRLGQAISVPWSRWQLSRPTVADRAVLLAPLDSRDVLCVDAVSGSLRWRRRLDDGVALLGRRDDRVLVQSHSGLYCLSLSDGETLWKVTTREPPLGRAALVNDAVYVPYHDSLRAWHVETGRAEAELGWPAWIADRGDLFAFNGVLAMVSSDRVTLSVNPNAPPATDGESAGYRFLRAVDEFLEGRPDEAARLLGTVLEEPGLPSDQAAVLLAETGLEFGRRHLLERALRNTPRTAELRAALAGIELRFALRHTPPERAASAYMELARNRGMEPAATSGGSASLWLRLRSAMEREHAGEPELRDELKRAFAQKVRSAAENGDEGALTTAARHAPFEQVRAEASLALGRFWEAAGRSDAARRAFTELALYGGDADVRRAAMGELETLRAALSPRAPAERALPGGEALWSAPGRLVLPAADTGPGDSLLLVDRERLRGLRVTDGKELWATELPPQPRIPAPVEIPERPRQLSGPGYPTYSQLGDRLAVSLPGNVFGVRGGDGELLWNLPAGQPWAHYAASTRVRKEDLVDRAVRGLPLPRAQHPVRRVRLDDFLGGPVALCRIEAGREVALVDTFSGRRLLRIEGEQTEELTGVMAATDQGRLWLALPAARELRVYDLQDGSITARWNLPVSQPLRGLLAPEPGVAVLADADTVYTFALFGDPSVQAVPAPRGVERLLYADRQVVVTEPMEGGAQCLPGPEGGPRLHIPSSEEWKTVWAQRDGDVLHVLEVANFRDFVPCGGQVHFRAESWRLRAVRLPDGQPLWEYAAPADSQLIVGPPEACGDTLLVPWHRADEAIVTGLDASGQKRFAVELPSDGPPGPVSLLTGPERVIVGLADRVVALSARQPSEGGR